MKKGAYDLGRKSLYYVVAIMIISLIFVYISNALYNYQEKGFENLNSMKGIGVINKVNSCFYFEDKEAGRTYPNTVDMEKFKQGNMEKCVEMPMTVTLTNVGDKQKTTTLSYKADTIREKQKISRIVTIIDKGEKEEGLLQIEIQK